MLAVGTGVRGDRLHHARGRRRASSSTSRPAGSGSRCWPPPWSRWPSSRCAAGRPAGQPARLRSRAQPYEALSDFSRRLAETPSPDDAAAGGRRGRRPGGVRAARDRDPGGAGRADAHRGLGRRRGRGHRRARGAGARTAAPAWAASRCACPRGRPLRPSDERLLDGAGRPDRGRLPQRRAGGRARRARGRARPHHPRAAASRARIIEADDAARRALEAAISREVLPHLVALPERLDRGAGRRSRAGAPRTGIDAPGRRAPTRRSSRCAS